MFTVFLVIQIILTISLVGLILIQRNDSDGLGSMGGGGGGNAFMTGRGQANLLTRATAILATLFMLNSLWLAIMVSGDNRGSSLADELAADDETISVPVVDDEDEGAATGVRELMEPEMPVTSTPSAEEPAEAPAEEAAPAEADTTTPVIPVP